MPLAGFKISQPEYKYIGYSNQNNSANSVSNGGMDIEMSRLTGTLRQISVLASYTAELFESIICIAEDTLERVHKADARVKLVLHKLPVILEFLEEFDPDRLRFTCPQKSGRVEYKFDEIPPIVFFSAPTMPRSLEEAYRYCDPLPPLHLFDPKGAHGVAIQYFSNPDFFFQVWLASERDRQLAAAAGKEATRQKRHLKKKKRRKTKMENELAGTTTASALSATTNALAVTLSSITSYLPSPMLVSLPLGRGVLGPHDGASTNEDVSSTQGMGGGGVREPKKKLASLLDETHGSLLHCERECKPSDLVLAGGEEDGTGGGGVGVLTPHLSGGLTTKEGGGGGG